MLNELKVQLPLALQLMPLCTWQLAPLPSHKYTVTVSPGWKLVTVTDAVQCPSGKQLAVGLTRVCGTQVAVGMGVMVGVLVIVGVLVTVRVLVGVLVTVDVLVTVRVLVGVNVLVGVLVGVAHEARDVCIDTGGQ